MPTTAIIENITFNSGTPDANGNTFWMQDIEGWDSPAVRFTSDNITAQHGSYIGENFYGGRPMTLKGFVTGQHWLGRRTLANALSIRGSKRLFTLTEDSPTPLTLRTEVVLSQPLRMKFTGPAAFTFEAPLFAPDPRKYSNTVTSQTVNMAAGVGSVSAPSITPGGNFPTPWTATVTTNGAWPGGTLQLYDNNDSRPRVQLAGVPQLGSGQQLVIDSLTRTITIAGSNRYDLLTQTSLSWADLQNATVWTVVRGTTTGTMQVVFTWRDAYV